jgi:putative SOS response-associated peptidase YedK
MLSWGFVLPQNGKAPRRVTNVRDDKVLTSRFWQDSFEKRRCLVPASSFCEPNGDVKPATWHWFALKGEEPRPLYAFPGIWRRAEIAKNHFSVNDDRCICAKNPKCRPNLAHCANIAIGLEDVPEAFSVFRPGHSL